MANVGLAALTFSLHVLALSLLSYCSSSSTTDSRTGRPKITILQLAITAVGLGAGSCTLCLPFLLSIKHPLAICSVRIISFFYCCKILDLTVVRARRPPTLLDSTGRPEFLSSSTQRSKYVWLLLTETRYFSFNIAVRQKGRPSPALPEMWDLSRLLVAPLLVALYPKPETKVLLVMLMIELSLEGIHSVLHASCPERLFWRPFAASSLANFWSTHWHAGAEPFLRSLGYEPGRSIARRLGLGSEAARAVGVLAAFNLSGLWHGWSVAALSNRPWLAGLQVWLVFVSMGIGVLLENLIPKTMRGSTVHKLLFWVFFMFTTGWAWRGLQRDVNVPWLANV